MQSSLKNLKLTVAVAATLVAGILPSSQAASILTNGDFEVQNPQLATNQKVASGFATLTGWSNTSTPTGNPDSGIQGSANGGQQPQSGSFFVFEQGGQPGAYQITGTTLNLGDQLTLTWYAYNSFQNPIQQVSLLSAVSQTTAYSATLPLAVANSQTNSAFALGGTYAQYTLNYTATANDVGSFVGVSLLNVGPGGTYINSDNYSLSVVQGVPEPSTWILMLGGLGAVMLRHRRRA